MESGICLGQERRERSWGWRFEHSGCRFSAALKGRWANRQGTLEGLGQAAQKAGAGLGDGHSTGEEVVGAEDPNL